VSPATFRLAQDELVIFDPTEDLVSLQIQGKFNKVSEQ